MEGHENRATYQRADYGEDLGILWHAQAPDLPLMVMTETGERLDFDGTLGDAPRPVAVEPWGSLAPSNVVAQTKREQSSRRRALGLCPTCGDVRLSRYERARGYQCGACTRRDEALAGVGL